MKKLYIIFRSPEEGGSAGGGTTEKTEKPAADAKAPASDKVLKDLTKAVDSLKKDNEAMKQNHDDLAKSHAALKKENGELAKKVTELSKGNAAAPAAVPKKKPELPKKGFTLDDVKYEFRIPVFTVLRKDGSAPVTVTAVDAMQDESLLRELVEKKSNVIKVVE